MPRTNATPRTLQELHGEPQDATLRNLVATLQAKLELQARYPLYEYEARADGNAACAELFLALAHVEGHQIDRLVEALAARALAMNDKHQSRRGTDAVAEEGRTRNEH